MRALRFVSPGQLPELVVLPDPSVKHPDDVLIQISFSGICGSDLKVLEGRYPARPGVILGHEASGVVVETGTSVKTLRPGDRVVAGIVPFCTLCSECRRGRPTLCEKRREVEVGIWSHGTFAELYLSRERVVYRLPDEIRLDLGALVEPMACVLASLNRVNLSYMQTALIIGAGPIGLLFESVLSQRGLRTRILEKNGYRIQFAKEREIGVLSSDLRDEDILTSVPEGCFDIVVDTVGSLLPRAVRLCHPGGHIILFGLDSVRGEQVSESEIVAKELTITGSIDCYDTIQYAISLLSRQPSFQNIITTCSSLEKYQEAFSMLGFPDDRARRSMKHIFQMGKEL